MCINIFVYTRHAAHDVYPVVISPGSLLSCKWALPMCKAAGGKKSTWFLMCTLAVM